MKNICEFCGQTLNYTPGKAGRPPKYHPKCKKAQTLLGWIEDLLEEIEPTQKKKDGIIFRLLGIIQHVENQ